MKVLLISSGSGSRGGGEIYLHLIAKGLCALGHDVSVMVPDNEIMNELAGQIERDADVVRFPFKPTYARKSRSLGAVLDRRQRTELEDLMLRARPDIVHINQQVSEDGLDIVAAAQKTGLPWLSTIHVGWGAKSLGARFGVVRDAVAKRMLQNAGGHHIAVSEASRQQLLDCTQLAPDRVRTVLNGVESVDDSELKLARKEARSEWGVSDADIVVGTVGRIEAQKDPVGFIERFSEIPASGGHRHLVWIGDGSLRSDLERTASQYSDRLTLHVDGWRSDASRRLAGLDVFALPSRFEGLPLALLEAMHAGLPIIANRADGIAEAIEHGRNGYLCETLDDWRRAADLLFSHDERRKEIGLEAARTAKQKFSVRSMSQSTDQVYRTVLTAHSSSNGLRSRQ